MRTVEIDNEPWFVGKDVAEALGYSDGFGALKKHVEAEDKQNCQNDSFDSPRGMTIINESGLYSLILSSKLPGAKEFKRWVTSEVIRRHIQGLMDTVIGNFASVIDLNETLHDETGLWVIEPEQYKRRVNR